MPGRNLSSTISHVAAHRGNVPVLKLALGLLMVAFFLLGLVLQIQTSEAFLLNREPSTLAANWGILAQPIALVNGTLPINMAKAVMWGWGIELVYLICVIGESSLGGRLHNYFKTGAIILVGFDFWTDFNYGTLASGFWGQVGFAGVTAFIVAFFGVKGINLIFEAITEWGS